MQQARSALVETYLSARTVRLRRKIVSGWSKAELRELARQLKDVCVEDWDAGPTRPRLAARLLDELASDHVDPHIAAYSTWSNGIKDLTFGRLTTAVEYLESAAKIFLQSGDVYESAKPQIALVTALAILGDYERVEKVGRRALSIFEKYNELIGAGKIEINLSNLASRRGQHLKAKKLALSARSRFMASGSEALRSVAENGLAITYTELYDFVSANHYFDSALTLAHKSGKLVTEAEIEASIGSLRLNRGDLAESLKAFELSRRKFESLQMPHKSLVAELEIAEIFAELNMTEEASEIYSRTAPSFAKLKMPVEEARARMGLGNLLIRTRQYRSARRQFDLSLKLFVEMGNANGQAIVILSQSWIELLRKRYDTAIELAQDAKRTFSRTGNKRQMAMADWVQGESYIGKGSTLKAIRKLRDASTEARQTGNSQVDFLSSVSLGNAELLRGDITNAIISFRRAIEISDSVRDPLVGDEFRISISEGKQEPYDRLASIFLDLGQIAEAFEIIESGRSRQLHDLVHSGRKDTSDKSFTHQISEIREILNWDYSRLRSAEPAESGLLRKKIARQEKRLTSLLRRSQSVEVLPSTTNRSLPTGKLKEIQSKLAPSTAMLYLYKLERSYSAFVITRDSIEDFRDLASEKRVYDLSLDLRFQLDTFRFGGRTLSKWGDQLKRRSDQILAELGDIFREPLGRMPDLKELVVIPIGEFHYVPFSALRDGHGYLAERFSVSCSPSASVWSVLRDRPKPTFKNALFVGFATESLPEVESEVLELAKRFKGSKCLVGEAATLTNFLSEVPGRDLIHIACHGDFRSDDPRYSALFMADGRINVNDISSANLSAGLVTLSACETGLNQIHDGNEIVGLSRGFLASGASSLVMSLWNVNDSATRDFMVKFYTALENGETVANALRSVQLQFIQSDDHPYFWAPFVAVG